MQVLAWQITTVELPLLSKLAEHFLRGKVQVDFGGGKAGGPVSVKT
jgi:hypothetical protein